MTMWALWIVVGCNKAEKAEKPAEAPVAPAGAAAPAPKAEPPKLRTLQLVDGVLLLRQGGADVGEAAVHANSTHEHLFLAPAFNRPAVGKGDVPMTWSWRRAASPQDELRASTLPGAVASLSTTTPVAPGPTPGLGLYDVGEYDVLDKAGALVGQVRVHWSLEGQMLGACPAGKACELHEHYALAEAWPYPGPDHPCVDLVVRPTGPVVDGKEKVKFGLEKARKINLRGAPPAAATAGPLCGGEAEACADGCAAKP